MRELFIGLDPEKILGLDLNASEEAGNIVELAERFGVMDYLGSIVRRERPRVSF